jgi:16S rRNA G966 N2-methylase RsmD
MEALSRGCEAAHFVEMDPWVTGKVLSQNIKTLGVGKQSQVHTAKVEGFLTQNENSARTVGGAFDFISFCPPYYKAGWTDTPKPSTLTPGTCVDLRAFGLDVSNIF